jgi:hypothetical protein
MTKSGREVMPEAVAERESTEGQGYEMVAPACCTVFSIHPINTLVHAPGRRIDDVTCGPRSDNPPIPAAYSATVLFLSY